MPRLFGLSVRQILVGGIAATALFLVGATIFVLSGLYNVSASREHLDVTTWLLEVVRRQSIRTHSLAVGTPPPVSEGALRLGAVHYELGCAGCHGAPGRPPSKIQDAMIPSPPSFAEAASAWTPRQLYWIVLNGQKYTGMPSWLAPSRRDEVWPMVAFLTRMPDLDAAAYRRMAGPAEGRPAARPALGAQTVGLQVCARCHGAPGEDPPIAIVPQLSGQNQAYLLRSLQDYAEDRRPSGYMQLIAGMLDELEMRELAAAYAGAPAPRRPAPAPATDAGILRRGEIMARRGLPEKRVPACLACHLQAHNPAFPKILGLTADYIEQQLRLFRDGTRDTPTYGSIMRAVAQRLSDDDMAAVGAYLSAMPGRTP
ncbi:c-type cytochrome [Reyranella sp.]|uniref:c-type cytochrome n=1 Tax=Reyranella sp. TaxID=1929291 RepID=UPI003BAD6BE1